MITLRVTLCAVCGKTISADYGLCGVSSCINEDFKRGRIRGLEAAAKWVEDQYEPELRVLAAEIRKLKEKP